MIELYKFLPKKYNPKYGYRNLQMGTLVYYSEMEADTNIADEGEGVNTIIIAYYDNKSADPYLKNKLALGGSDFKMKGIVFKKRSPNCYIYCLSMNDLKEINGSHFCDNYNSYFKIKNITKFINEISANLKKQIQIHDFEDSVIQEINNPVFINHIKLHVFHNAVAYNNSKTTYVENSKIWMNKEIPEWLEVVFTKDNKFIKDKEYRIAFIFEYNGLVISVKKAPKIIHIDNLFKVVR